MNIQKFTQKSIEAIQKAQSLVIENENSQIEQVFRRTAAENPVRRARHFV